MMVHDVGTGRGGTDAALGRITAHTLVINVDSDRLFLPEQAQQMTRSIPHASSLTLTSLYGHDGFLVETEQMDRALRNFLAELHH